MEKRTRISRKTDGPDVPVPERLREINGTQLHAVLATASEEGPYTSLVAFALTPDARGIVFATGRTAKYRNILRNKHVSLLMDTRTNTSRDYMDAESVTVQGDARPVRKGKLRTELARILLQKHPHLREFVHSEETALIMVQIRRCIHVSRFQEISQWKPE